MIIRDIMNKTVLLSSNVIPYHYNLKNVNYLYNLGSVEAAISIKNRDKSTIKQLESRQLFNMSLKNII